MTVVNYFLLAFLSSLVVSCSLEPKGNVADSSLIEKKDTTDLLGVVKSYEPKIYKGKVPKAFYNNRGSYDWWRFPLVYPYSIGCIDVRDYGRIFSDKDRTDYDEGGSITPLTSVFDKFIFDKYYFVASKCKTPFERDAVKVVDQYFVFSFRNGSSKEIKGIDSLWKILKQIKFSGDTTFMTIREYEDRLW